MLSTNVLRHGRDEPEAKQVILRAGPLEAVFEPDTAWLRYIRLGNREVIRAIYSAVRDELWQTALPRISDLKIVSADGGFDVTFTAACVLDAIDFLWKGRISAPGDGTIRYSMDGQARSTFMRNRIGFCVLHPTSCAGQACELIRADGSGEHGQFPVEISPHQPFMNLAGMVQEVAPGISTELRFEGDVFETEDQRNWTDASYKTYCTPLDLPRPVQIATGTKIQQAVTLRLHGAQTRTSVTTSAKPEVSVRLGGKSVARLPQFGLGMASHDQALSAREVALLRELKPGHLRADLHLGDPRYIEVLEQAAAQSTALGAPIEAAIFLGQDHASQLQQLVDTLRQFSPAVTRWLVLSESAESVATPVFQAASAALTQFDRSASFGVGTNQYFTELNRQRPQADGAKWVSYSFNPQVHAFDDRSVMETIEAQPATVKSARKLYPNQDVAVSPITLRPRFNPHLPSSNSVADATGLPKAVDVRQMSLFTAAWTLASIRALTQAGASSLTYFETTGWRGVIETDAGSANSLFPSFPGAVFPVFHVLADLTATADGAIDLCECSDPSTVAALALTDAGRRVLLIANLTPDPQAVTLPNRAESSRVRMLDETTAEHAMRSAAEYRAQPGRPLTGDKLQLLPYAVARVEL